MAYIISSGEILSGIILENDTMTILGGGTANNTTVNSNGSLAVASDGMADNTTVNAVGNMVVKGGTANNTTVNSGGKMSISSDGTANSIKVNCGGTLSVGKDCTATIIENGGNVIVKEGAIVTFLANTFSAVTLNDKTTATVHSGTTAASTTVNAGGRMTISSGGLTSSAIINAGGSLFLSSGGTAENTRIGFGGRMTISSGATAEKTNATSSGTVTVLNGGAASNVCVRADGRILISSDGKLTGKVLCLKGIISAASGAIVDFDLTHKLPGAAALYFFDSIERGIQGAPTFTVTVNPDQAEGIYSLCNLIKRFNEQITVQNTEGTALGVLSVGETVTISDTAYTLNLTDNQLILKIGEIITPSPYTSDGVVVYNGSIATVSSGGIYHDTEIWGGQLYVLSGGTADIVSVHPFSRGSVFISSGGSANSVMVNSFCSVFVSGGGTVNRVELKSGSELRVFSGGTATEVKEDGGYVSVANGADVTFTPNTINGLLLENANATVHSVTTVNNITLNTSANLFIFSGGVANNTTVNSGWFHISSGGKANSTAIIKGTREVGGAMFVSRGGVADDTTIHGGGWMDVSSGGVANNTIVNASMFVYSGGIANGITVSSSGVLHVGFSSGNWFEHGGMANDIVVSGGSMNVAYGGEANRGTVNTNGRLSVFSGGKVNSTTVNGSASMFVSSSGKAICTTVNSGGRLFVSSGGTATEITENGGYVGVADGADVTFVSNTFSGVVLSNASATLHSGTTANNTTISGGRLTVFSGGKANSTTLNSGGRLYVSSGGTATGKMTFADGAIVSAFRGAILDFDISQVAPGDEARLNDLSIIRGSPVYLLTVSETQSDGVYSLAEGAAYFSGTITVVNVAGDELGTLSVGEKVSINDMDYMLNLGTDDVLSVTVGAVAPEPEPVAITPEFLTGRFAGGIQSMLAKQADGVVTIYQNGAAWGAGLTLDPGWDVVGTGDFNADGRDDFLRVNTEGYVVGEMANDNGTFSPQVLNMKGPGWDILGTGDFNGNGSGDVLVANPTGASETVGLLGYWESGVTWTLINGYSPEWECVSTGDFNGDGKCDMLWRNSFIGEGGLTYNAYCTWIVDNPVDWRMVSVANPTEWNFLCSGDFDGNGSHDIAMINDVGVVGIWGVSDGYLNSWSILSAVDTSAWTLAGVGDFNTDGTDDIAWASDELNLAGYWQINDKQLTTWANIASLA